MVLEESGADTRIRTGDLPLTRRLLYQLSYAGKGTATALPARTAILAQARAFQRALLRRAAALAGC